MRRSNSNNIHRSNSQHHHLHQQAQAQPTLSHSSSSSFFPSRRNHNKLYDFLRLIGSITLICGYLYALLLSPAALGVDNYSLSDLIVVSSGTSGDVTTITTTTNGRELEGTKESVALATGEDEKLLLRLPQRSLKHLRILNVLSAYRDRPMDAANDENNGDDPAEQSKGLNEATTSDGGVLANVTSNLTLSDNIITTTNANGTNVTLSVMLTSSTSDNNNKRDTAAPSSFFKPLLILSLLLLLTRALLNLTHMYISDESYELEITDMGQVRRRRRRHPSTLPTTHQPSSRGERNGCQCLRNTSHLFRTLVWETPPPLMVTPNTTSSGNQDSSSSSSNNMNSAERRQRRAQQFLIERLNQQRIANGEQPISRESMNFLWGSAAARDFDGNDYDQLWGFLEEQQEQQNSGGWGSQMGATDVEIGRCPVRVLGEEDREFLVSSSSTSSSSVSTTCTFCAICLEEFCVGEEVRTISCSHTFHSKCVDPWLRQKAICPVCKQSAIDSN